jgi:hypothetical protein
MITFHHIGFIVDNIEKYADQMLLGKEIKSVYDPIQDATLTLYSNFGSSYIELIQPNSDKAFTYNFLKNNGNGFHHTCYQISSIEEMDTLAKSLKLLKIRGPLKALLFDNSDVFFYFSRNKTIIEFLIQ